MLLSEEQDDLRERLADLSMFSGKPLEIHDKISSTSDRMTELAKAGAPEGSLVVARTQAAGRGRLGRKFVSPEGGLYFTVLLRRKEVLGEAPTSLLMGLASSQAIDEVARVATYLKWPNDVLLEGLKVAGVLTEYAEVSDGPRLMVGVGINVNVPMKSVPFLLRSTMTSILLQTGHHFDLNDILAAVLCWFQGHLATRAEGKGPLLIGQMSDRMPLVGKEVKAKIGRETIKGRIMALTSSGALILETKSGRRTVAAGEIEQLRGR